MAGKKKKSTTPSGTNLKSLRNYIFFLDRALESYAVRDTLLQMGAQVVMHRDRFKEDAIDEDWLPIVAEKKWVVLSKDQFNYLERLAIRNAKGRAFYLVRRDLSGPEMAEIIRKAMPKILRILDESSPPLMAKIYRDSSIDLISLD
jgi:PIN like domain